MIGVMSELVMPGPAPAGEPDLFAQVDAWLGCLQEAHRVEARVAAVKARFAAELARSTAVFEHADRNGVVNAVTAEIAMALGVTRMAASRLVRVGLAAEGKLVATGAAFAAGDISLDKAWIFTDRLDGVVPEVAWAVEERVLPTAPARSTTELCHDIDRALIELDPDNADVRHKAARRTRHVTRPEVLADGMARMSVFLPAEQAVTLDRALDACAAAALRAGDTRTCTQLRADAIAEWARRTLERGWRFTTSSGSDVRTAPTRVNVTVPLEVLARAMPDWQPPASVAAVFAAREGLLPACPDGAVGHRTEAAWLEGYGPIAPAIALLLAAGGTWRRIVTDTLTCIPLDIGHHRYRPPAHIAEAVRLRDHTCTRPTCSVPARVCQLDHAEEWQHGGGTSRDELGCLCGRCHREKSIGAGRPGRRKKDGTRDWHSATGRIYPNHPERPPRLHGGPLRGGSLNLAPDPEDLPPDPGPPPF